MSMQSTVFWGLATFSTTFAFTARRRLVCLIVFGVGTAVALAYGVGMIAEAVILAQLTALWNVFNAFGTSNLLVNLGAGAFGSWLGGQFVEAPVIGRKKK